MTPASPVIPGLTEVVYAKNQPEYIPLPAVRGTDGSIVTRWRCSLWERFRILLTGDVYHSQLTYGQQLQPVKLETIAPTVIR